MPLRLPPLSALRFFEAAGRHRSFKLAADELNVTPSAISHGIVALERSLGVTLFERTTRKLHLTAAGADYLTYVSEAFALIAIGTERLPSKHARREITVSCAPSLAALWLLPRLNGFIKRWPNLHVSVDTSRRVVGFPVDGFDFAIRRADVTEPPKGWHRLFAERLVPVHAPGQHTDPNQPVPRTDLSKVTLIHVTTVGEEWRTWWEWAKGITPDLAGLDIDAGMRVDTIQLAQDASATGLGVAMGRRPLVDSALASGALVVARPEMADTQGAYWLVGSEGADHRPDLVAFKRWLLEEARATAAALSTPPMTAN